MRKNVWGHWSNLIFQHKSSYIHCKQAIVQDITRTRGSEPRRVDPRKKFEAVSSLLRLTTNQRITGELDTIPYYISFIVLVLTYDGVTKSSAPWVLLVVCKESYGGSARKQCVVKCAWFMKPSESVQGFTLGVLPCISLSHLKQIAAFTLIFMYDYSLLKILLKELRTEWFMKIENEVHLITYSFVSRCCLREQPWVETYYLLK